MSADARLHVRAAVWGEADNRIAVLLVEVGRLVPAALLGRGLGLITELDRLILRTVRGWRVDAGQGSGVTVRWPGRRALLADVPVELPGVWRWAARRRGAVLFLVGSGLGLSASEPEGRRRRLLAAAVEGRLVGGAVPFREGLIASATEFTGVSGVRSRSA